MSYTMNLVHYNKKIKLFFALTFTLIIALQPAITSATEKVSNQNKVVDVKYREELEKLYELSQNHLIWSKSGTLTRQSFDAIQSLQQSSSIGLSPEEYSTDQLVKLWNDLTTSVEVKELSLSEFDVSLSIALMQFISDLHLGRVDPRETGFNIVVSEKSINLAETILAYSRSNNMWEAIQRLEPRFKAYQRLKQALSHYRQIQINHQWQPLFTEKTVHPGDQYEDLIPLGEMLSAVGDLDPSIPVDAIYSGEMIEAVKRFQRRHGLEDDGLIGVKTFRQLNTPLSKRVEQIELAMERLRWIPQPKDGPHIVVNIPAFELYAFHVKNAIESIELKMNVIVGSTINKHETPVFMADMKYLVFRPYWNVPYNITVKELLPKMKNDFDYLYAHDYEILEGHTIISTGYFDQDMINGLQSGQFHIRQRPGEKNALGLVKFIFPNSNSVYLHDTPTRKLFSHSRRDFSHGCIRVEAPSLLAEFVLRAQGSWDKDSIDNAIQGENDLKVNLTEDIPVHIFYTTVIVRENGDIVFFDDIYGHDQRLRQLLINRSQN